MRQERFQSRQELIRSGWLEKLVEGDRAYCAIPECMEPWQGRRGESCQVLCGVQNCGVLLGELSAS